MSQVNANFVITKVEIIDESSVAVISFTVNYASHSWKRQTRIDLATIEKFTYEDLRKRVRVAALELINKRAPLENNIRRLEKMVGQERSF